MGATVLEAARAAGFPIATECGGFGKCTRCRVLLPAPAGEGRAGPRAPAWLEPPGAAERRQLGSEALSAGWRLACQVRAWGDLSALVPYPADQVARKSIDTSLPLRLSPWAERVAVALDAPGAEGASAAVRRFLESRHLESKGPRLPGGKVLPLDGEAALRVEEAAARARGEARAITLTLCEGAVVDAEAGDTSRKACGAVIDIGTTQVCGYLLRLADGSLCAEASRLNGQRAWGADLMSRVHAASPREGGGGGARGRLTAAVRSDVNLVLGDLLRRARVRRRDLIALVFVGNSVMHHLFLGLPVASFGAAPYAPVRKEGVAFRPRELGLRTSPAARAHFLPLLAGFVGADAVGVALALGLGLGLDAGGEAPAKPLLALDLGTNVELLLARPDGTLWCASTPAGPAFEGGGIRCGMPSAPGAVSEVEAAGGRLAIRTIEGLPPAGICGTGLIDAAGCLLDLGALEPSGRIVRPRDLREGGGGEVGRRIVEEEGGRAFVLAPAEETASGAPLALTQWDVRKLQSAKAAVRAGADLLLREAGLGWEEVGTICLAGAFGARLRPERAIRIGLLPPLPPERIRIVHNAAASGGRLALLSAAKLGEAGELRARVRHVELAGRPEFQEAFIEALPFPAGPSGADSENTR